jgi:GxxExxY protein
MAHTRTANELNATTEAIIGAAITVHRALGPGLLESAYLACLAHELARAGIPFEAQRAIPLDYGALHVVCAYRADLLVEHDVIVEVKALDIVTPVHMRQLRTYMQLADCRVGLLLNFGAVVLRQGIHRSVNRFPGV